MLLLLLLLLLLLVEVLLLFVSSDPLLVQPLFKVLDLVLEPFEFVLALVSLPLKDLPNAVVVVVELLDLDLLAVYDLFHHELLML